MKDEPHVILGMNALELLHFELSLILMFRDVIVIYSKYILDNQYPDDESQMNAMQK